MNLTDSLGPTAKKLHQNGINIDDLKLHQINHQFKNAEINWSTVIAIIPINHGDFKAIVIDRIQCIFAVKQTINQLFR